MPIGNVIASISFFNYKLPNYPSLTDGIQLRCGGGRRLEQVARAAVGDVEEAEAREVGQGGVEEARVDDVGAQVAEGEVDEVREVEELDAERSDQAGVLVRGFVFVFVFVGSSGILVDCAGA